MNRVFWDTNLFIYLFEKTPLVHERVLEVWQSMKRRGDRLFTSALAVGEILVRPLQLSRQDLAKRYLELFRSDQVTVLPFAFDAVTHYARIRQDRAIRPPDAIHLACAAAAGIDLFLTNDASLPRTPVPGIRFISTLQRAPL